MVCIALHVEKSKESEVTDSEEDEEDKEDEEGPKGNEQKIKEVDVEKEKENEESRRGFSLVGATQQRPTSLHAEIVFDDWENHLSVKHLSVEGQLEFCALSFVPHRATLSIV